VCQTSVLERSGTRGITMKPKDMIMTTYKEDNVDPNKYLFLYSNRMQKMRLRYFSLGAVSMTAIAVLFSVPVTLNEISTFQWSEFSLYHPVLLYSFAVCFSSGCLFALLKALIVTTHLKSIYRNREKDEYLAIKYTNFLRNRTEMFTFTLADCANYDDNKIVVGNIYIKNTMFFKLLQ